MPTIPPQDQSGLQTSTCFFEEAPVSIWVKDFSAVKRYFEALKQKGIQDFRTYFENHPEEVVWLTQEVKVIDVNKRTVRLYQAKDKEELLNSLNKVFNKESYETSKEELISLAEGKTEFIIEAFNLTLKGEGLFFLLKMVVPTGHANTLSRVLAYAIDITTPKAREEELKQTNEMGWKLFNFAPDAILVVEINTGIIVKVNREAESLLGIPAEQIVGMHCSDLFPKEARQEYHEAFRRHMSKENSFSDQLAIFDRDSGRTIPVSTRSSLVEIEGKQYLIGSFRAPQRKNTSPSLEALAKGALQRRLTEREREVVQLVATGHTSRQIASRLSISEKTVETHRARIMKKFDFHRTADLVRYAISLMLID